MKIIEDIERLSADTEPAVQVLELKYADNESVVTLVTPVYEQFFAPRYGRVSMTPLVKPNAILVVGRPDSVAAARRFDHQGRFARHARFAVPRVSTEIFAGRRFRDAASRRSTKSAAGWGRACG